MAPRSAARQTPSDAPRARACLVVTAAVVALATPFLAATTSAAQAALVPCDRDGPGPVFGRDQGAWGEPITAQEWIGVRPGDTDNGGWEIPRPLLEEIFGPALIPFGPSSQDDPQRWVVLINGALKLRTLVIPNEFQPRPLDTPGLPPMFAAYWNDIETTLTGDVFICVRSDGTPSVVTPGDAIILTWDGVPAKAFDGFSDRGFANFQLVIRVGQTACDGDNVARNVTVEFRYRRLQWQTVVDFLSRSFVSRAGFADSEGNVIELRGSGEDPAESLLENSNTSIPGLYRFTFSRNGPRCGDGVTDNCELCDDGNDDNDDDCTNSCGENVCGDGFVDRQGPDLETCDGEAFLNQVRCPEGFEGVPLCNNDPQNTTTFDDTCTFTLGGCTEIPRCDDGTLPPCIVDAGVDPAPGDSPGAGLDRIQVRGGCALRAFEHKGKPWHWLAAVGIALARLRRRARG